VLKKKVRGEDSFLGMPSFPTLEESDFPEPVEEPMQYREQPYPQVQPQQVDVKPEVPSPPEPSPVPHMYIRVSKYREVLKKLDELKQTLESMKMEIEELKRINSSENSKIEQEEAIASKLSDILQFLESTFVKPEE